MNNKFLSRKFLLALATVIYSVASSKPEWAAASVAIYTLVQGLIDLYAVKDPAP